MAEITNVKKIRADLYDNSVVIARAKQYDKATRYLNITCTNDGEVVPILSSECRAMAKILTPDGRNIHDTALINDSDGTITVELTDSILHTAGSAYIDVNLYSKSKEALLTSMTIKLIIARSVYDDGREINSDEFNALTDLLAEVVKSENDRTTAENIRITNEKDRQDHEAERQENERVRKNAENARIANEDNRTSHFNDMIRIADEKTKEAENVNIEAWATPADPDAQDKGIKEYGFIATNRKGEKLKSPNLLNHISIGTVTSSTSGSDAEAELTGVWNDQKLNLVLPRGERGGKGTGFYRYNGELTSTNTSCLRNSIQPSGELFVGDTIIDTNGEMFMVTKDYSSGSTVSIKYINGLIDYMIVEEFDAIFAENE